LRRKQKTRPVKSSETAARAARAAAAAVEKEEAWKREREAREERAKQERQRKEAQEAPWSRKPWTDQKPGHEWRHQKPGYERRRQQPKPEACTQPALPDEPLVKLNAEAAKGAEYLLVHVYAHFPPPRGPTERTLMQLKQDLKRSLRTAMRDYHPDNSSAHVLRADQEALYLEIPKLINAAYSEMFRAKAGFDESWKVSGTQHGG